MSKTHALPITRGPKFHWFGYYDKLQFDPSNRFVLGMEVDFEHRSPSQDDHVAIGLIDLADGNRWTELGISHAWCWQQGCMLQWRPGSLNEIMWNDRDGDRFVSHIVNVDTGEKRTLERPFYTISPDGRSAIAADFSRINHMRPGYGYPGIPDPNFDSTAPKDSGVSRIDLESGDEELIISIADTAAISGPREDSGDAKHYFNHLLFNPDGSRFIFLHRWRGGSDGFKTRMMTAACDGSDIRVVDDSGSTSHFIWRGTDRILAWSQHASHGPAFYLFEDKPNHRGTGPDPQVVGKSEMREDGHCSYLPGSPWIINDCYPGQREPRLQHLYLYNPDISRRVDLGAYMSPGEYLGEWRCDLHPRCSNDGRKIVIDSPHGGNGRQMYLIDIEDLQLDLR